MPERLVHFWAGDHTLKGDFIKTTFKRYVRNENKGKSLAKMYVSFRLRFQWSVTARVDRLTNILRLEMLCSALIPPSGLRVPATGTSGDPSFAITESMTSNLEYFHGKIPGLILTILRFIQILPITWIGSPQTLFDLIKSGNERAFLNPKHVIVVQAKDIAKEGISAMFNGHFIDNPLKKRQIKSFPIQPFSVTQTWQWNFLYLDTSPFFHCHFFYKK